MFIFTVSSKAFFILVWFSIYYFLSGLQLHMPILRCLRCSVHDENLVIVWEGRISERRGREAQIYKNIPKAKIALCARSKYVLY